MTDREMILAEIERLGINRFFSSYCKALRDVRDFIAALPAEPEPMVRLALLNNDPEVEEIQIFHPSINMASGYTLEFIDKMKGRNFRLAKIEIREVQND